MGPHAGRRPRCGLSIMGLAWFLAVMRTLAPRRSVSNRWLTGPAWRPDHYGQVASRAAVGTDNARNTIRSGRNILWAR